VPGIESVVPNPVRKQSPNNTTKRKGGKGRARKSLKTHSCTRSFKGKFGQDVGSNGKRRTGQKEGKVRKKKHRERRAKRCFKHAKMVVEVSQKGRADRELLKMGGVKQKRGVWNSGPL